MSDLELGILTTFEGMAIVFLTLIVLFGLISLFALLKEKPRVAPVVKEVAPKEIISQESTDLSDDLELVAVISAAIAAYTGRSVDNLVVKRINRVSSQSTSWSKLGLQDQMGERL